MTIRAFAAVGLAAIIIAGAGGAAQATHPGSNGVIGFERPDKTGADLFAIGAGGGAADALVVSKGLASEVSFSPDGKKIAYTYSKSPESKPFEIYVADADGSNARRLTRHGRFSNGPAWSPDSKRIVYATETGPDPKAEDRFPPLRLHVVNADGSGDRLIDKHDVGLDHVDPSFTPDGKRIVFCILDPKKKGLEANIVSIPAGGGKLTNLTPRGGEDELNPSPAPDGESILYEASAEFSEKQSDIAIMGSDGTGDKRLTSTPFHETNPVWSPDGTRIAFTSDRDNRKLSKERLGRGFEVYTMAAGGEDIVRLTENKRPEFFPDWQTLPAEG